MASSDDKPIRPIDKRLKQFKRLKELNRRNREFWEGASTKLQKQLERWPDFAQQAVLRMEWHARLHRGEIPSFEVEVNKLVAELGLNVELTPREQKIWKVIEQSGAKLKAAMYCRELEGGRVKTPMAWRRDDCPSSYVGAYLVGQPWHNRIADEKWRIKKKGELSQLVEQTNPHDKKLA